MTISNADIAALVSSRICHDLISPVGAIGNGVELLELAGGRGDAEIKLISQSVENANARLRFFRIAFGLAERSQTVAASEIAAIFADLSADGRTHFLWIPDEAVSRVDARAIFLALMCLQRALPHGDAVQVSGFGAGWVLRVETTRHRIDDTFRDRIEGRVSGDISPRDVEFTLLPNAALDAGLKPGLDVDDTGVTLAMLSKSSV